ncbi:hypothetical protein CBOS2020_20870 [Clostridium botulinum]|nr:hypothetical protein CBOS2020_20870 [Clostridium botulinum]
MYNAIYFKETGQGFLSLRGNKNLLLSLKIRLLISTILIIFLYKAQNQKIIDENCRTLYNKTQFLINFTIVS